MGFSRSFPSLGLSLLSIKWFPNIPALVLFSEKFDLILIMIYNIDFVNVLYIPNIDFIMYNIDFVNVLYINSKWFLDFRKSSIPSSFTSDSKHLRSFRRRILI